MNLSFFSQQNFVFINLRLRSRQLPPALLRRDSPKCTFPSLIPVRTHIYTLIAVSPWLNSVHCGSEHLFQPWVSKGDAIISNCSERKMRHFFEAACLPVLPRIMFYLHHYKWGCLSGSSYSLPQCVRWNVEPQLSQHWREGSLPSTHSDGSQHLVPTFQSANNHANLKIQLSISLMYTSSLETGLNTSFCFCFVFWVWS